MNFLADENIPSSLIKALRDDGHKVKDLKEERLIGISDKEVTELARKENLVVLTYDKDFLHFIQLHQPRVGIIVLRFKNPQPQRVIPQLLSFIKSSLSKRIENSLCILSEEFVEIRKL
ncbi:MAG TPA: DUF5615 family PIN-like protein [Candidatus Nanoarchaeia archaeon]|nr:DUF5615 family PIN-like protein [Candidatus Nanoarchaeia archaeon]